MASCFVGLPKALPHRHRSLAADDHGRSRRARPLERTEPPTADGLEAALAGLRGDIELPIPTASAVKIGGERAYRLHRQGVVVEMPLRSVAGRRARRHRVYRTASRRSICVSAPGTYVRSIADALGGHCVALRTNGGRAVLRRRSRRRAGATARGRPGAHRAHHGRSRGRAAEKALRDRQALKPGRPRSSLRRLGTCARRGRLAGENASERGAPSQEAPADEDRSLADPARAPAAGGRDRHVRRRSSGPPECRPGRDRLRSRADRDHVRSAPADRARELTSS